MDTSTVIDFNEQRIIREINDLCVQLAAATRTSTEVAIRIGELLVEVKGTLPHGQWVPWIKANCRFSDVTAGKYMRAFHAMKPELSSSLPQNEAPTITALGKQARSQREPKKPAKVPWTHVFDRYLRDTVPPAFIRWLLRSKEGKEEVAAELGQAIPKFIELESHLSRDLADAVQRCSDKVTPDVLVERVAQSHAQAAARIDDLRAQVPENAKERFDRLLQETRAVMADQFELQVEARVKALFPIERERLICAAEKHEAESAALLGVRMTIDGIMTQDEFKLVLGCLHPDKHHGSEQARFSRAFHIFKQLERTVNTYLPAAELKKRGWPANPFSRKPS